MCGRSIGPKLIPFLHPSPENAILICSLVFFNGGLCERPCKLIPHSMEVIALGHWGTFHVLALGPLDCCLWLVLQPGHMPGGVVGHGQLSCLCQGSSLLAERVVMSPKSTHYPRPGISWISKHFDFSARCITTVRGPLLCPGCKCMCHFEKTKPVDFVEDDVGCGVFVLLPVTYTTVFP